MSLRLSTTSGALGASAEYMALRTSSTGPSAPMVTVFHTVLILASYAPRSVCPSTLNMASVLRAQGLTRLQLEVAQLVVLPDAAGVPVGVRVAVTAVLLLVYCDSVNLK
jgi:hypothetical protein